MHDDIAIRLTNVSKAYRLYSSRWHLAVDTLGLGWMFPKIIQDTPTFLALKNLSLTVPRGSRLGVVGRNGAGKTTLLKLLTGNFAPTQGQVEVTGRIQALMDVGLGFHPDFTGFENIQASLAYNGLPRAELERAVEDVIDFVELGDFLHQPIKTYSLGMLSRLGFATSTAIKPDVLIIDEVLGAGDAYFASKSSARMKRLTSDGTTLLLVSHSNQQILQFCEEAIWLERGELVGRGNAMEVVKAYDAHIRELEDARMRGVTEQARAQRLKPNLLPTLSSDGAANLPATELATGQSATTRAVSRWKSTDTGLRIDSLQLCDSTGTPRYVAAHGDHVEFKITYSAESDGDYECRFVLYIFALDGRPLTLHVSDWYRFSMKSQSSATISLTYDRLLLGNGEYVVSVAIYKHLDMNDLSTARTFDLLDKSFQFKVFTEFPQDDSIFLPPATWRMENDSAARAVTHERSKLRLSRVGLSNSED